MLSLEVEVEKLQLKWIQINGKPHSTKSGWCEDAIDRKKITARQKDVQIQKQLHNYSFALAVNKWKCKKKYTHNIRPKKNNSKCLALFDGYIENPAQRQSFKTSVYSGWNFRRNCAKQFKRVNI